MNNPIKLLPKSLVAGLALSAVSLSTQAETVSYSDLAPLADAEISGILSVPGFDSSLGTLTGVYWEVEGAFASILGIENDSGNTISGSAFTEVEFDVDSPLLSMGASPDFSIFGSTGQVTLGVGAAALFPVVTSTTISGYEAGSPAFFRPATVDMSYLTTTYFGSSATGGDVTIGQSTDAGIKLTVTYEYTTEVTPVPLPAAAPLMGAGLTFFSLIARRRRNLQ